MSVPAWILAALALGAVVGAGAWAMQEGPERATAGEVEVLAVADEGGAQADGSDEGSEAAQADGEEVQGVRGQESPGGVSGDVGGWNRQATAGVAGAAATGAGLVAVAFLKVPWLRHAAFHFPAFLAGLFSRIGTDELLDHPVRAAIAQHVHDRPGIHYRALQRELDIGHGTLHYHTQRMAAYGLLVVRHANGYACFFPAGTTPDMDEAGALASETARRVAQGLARTGSGPTALARSLGMPVSTVRYHLQRFEQVGLADHHRGRWTWSANGAPISL